MEQSLKVQMMELQQLLLYRGFILLCFCPCSIYKDFKPMNQNNCQKNNQINDVQSLRTKQFLINLFIACTRAWEGYEEKNFFEQLYELYPIDDIKKSFNILKALIQNPPIIRRIQNEIWINRAKTQYRIHKIILTQISQTEITDEILDKFFLYNQIYEIQYLLSSSLQGLSSFNGQYSYFWSDLDQESYIKSLIHEFTHNLFRFIKKNQDFNYLSPKINRELRIYNQFSGKYEQCEAGQYFDRNAEIKQTFAFISPFNLLEQDQ